MDKYTATEIAYKNGYAQGRKDAAREIFEEIDLLFERFYDDPSYSSGELGYDIAELKKKYTEGKDINDPPKKDFFTPKEVALMSPKEVRKNYSTIMESMKEW